MRTVLIASMCLLLPFVAGAQDFSFPAGTAGEAAVEKALPALAGQVIAAYKEESRAAYLDNLFRLQIVAGRHADALRTLATLHELVVNPRSPQTAAYNVEDQIFARAKVIEGGDGTRDAFGRQAESIFGYRRDPAAHVDLVELRYQWFDYVFKGAPRPAVLRDRVNYEVTGANVWKHAPSVAAMSASKMRLHLTALKRGAMYRLSEGKHARDGFIMLTVNFADRSDVDKPSPGGGVLDKEVDSTNGLVFVSDPFTKPVEMSGLFFGRLGFITNKKDFDFEIDLYQMTPKGEYLQLAPYWARASYVRDRTRRQLLAPGRRERLDFGSFRLMSSRCEPGSRLVAVLRVIKEPGREINYGSGKPVTEETIADAGEPLRIDWYGDSYIEVPVRE